MTIPIPLVDRRGNVDDNKEYIRFGGHNCIIEKLEVSSCEYFSL